MIKKLLETSLGNSSETAFVYKGVRILNLEDLPKILSKECSPYVTKDNGGVIVYFSEEEYKKLKNEDEIKKTDLEKFVELYKSVGIELKVRDCEKRFGEYKGGKIIEMCDNDCEKFGGYAGFCSSITFDENGKFLKQDFYE